MKEKGNRLVVADAGWAETAPDWLKKAIEKERLVQGFADAMGKGKEEVGDAEVCLYLYTLNLKQSVSHETAQLYIYLSSKLMKKHNPKTKLESFMEEKLKQGLEPDEERVFQEMKRDLWRTRGGKIKSPLFEALAMLKTKGG